MGRKQDRFWKYVEKLENERFKCKFCMEVYAGGISRIKPHLSGIEGRGIKICKRIPKDVKRAAYKEIEGASKKRKAPSSSTSDGENDAAADSPPEQDNATGSQPIDGLENEIDDRSRQLVLGDMAAEERRETGKENVYGESMHTPQKHREKDISRRKDEFWQYAEKLDNDRFRCSFCQSVYAGGASRIKSHLSKVKGRGIKICERVPAHVERLAYEEIGGGANKKRKSMPSPANDMDATANSTPEKDSGVANRVGDVERRHIVVPSMQQDLGTGGNHVSNVTGIGENGNGDCEEPRPPTQTRTYAADMMPPVVSIPILSASSASCSFTESRINDKMNSFEKVLAPDESSASAEAIEGPNNEVNSSKNDTLNREQLGVAEGSKQSTGQKTRGDESMVAELQGTQPVDGVENLVNDVEREGVQISAQVAEEWRSSTSVGVGNHGENVNEALLQPVDMGVSAVGNGAVDWNEDVNVTKDWSPSVPNDRLAPDRQMSDMNDLENFVIEPPEIQLPFETVPLLEEGESSTANMNSQLVNQVQGVTIDESREVQREMQVSQAVEGLQFSENGGIAAENISRELIHQVAGVRTAGDRGVVMENMTEVLVPSVGGGGSADDQGRDSENMIQEQMIQLSENGGIAAENISGEVAGGRTAGDRGDVMENMTEVLVPSVGGGRSADDRGRDSENMIQEQMIQPVGRVVCAEVPDSSAHQTKGDTLLTEKLFGKAFERNKRRIWEYLMNDEILCIGIWGMGGAGKTTLVTHINNQLLNMPNPFRKVYWVTVSQDFSIPKLQTRISRTIGIDLSDEDDERKRAAKLFKELQSRHRSVLILDDLWDAFSLVKVGIPVGVNGCKLILTTRSFEICRRMDCQEMNIIKVEPLGEEEAWKLFLETLGHGVSLPLEITEVAKGITKECGGLPLAIITMAGTMKGVDHKCEWERALETLKESEAGEGDMDKDVFRVLKFSYDRLSSTLKQCFLYFGLFLEDFHVSSTDLIGYLIEEGIIKGKRSLRAHLDEGLVILNKLKRACLLEDCGIFYHDDCVKMHDLVRDMAVQILRVNSKAMVEAGKQLEELPDEENWKEDLVTVSLMNNNIKKIPSAYSPNCPNLSTLLLCENEGLELISGSFFEKLNGLKILDLSDTRIEELPDSVSELVNLTSLLLRWCERLTRVPSLAKLKALKKLDLRGSGIEEIPHGMEFLSNLVYLGLHDTRLSKQFPIGILPRLSKLQFLDLGEGIAEAREVASLKKLEFVRVRFSDLHCWKTCVQFLEGLCTCSFLLAPRQEFIDRFFFEDSLVSKILARENEVIIRCLDITNEVDFLALPKNVHQLLIWECHELKSLYTAFAFSLHHATQLKELSVRDCDGMEWLHYNLPESLEKLHIENLRNLCSLLSEEGGVAQLQPPFPSIGNDSNINNVIFSNLKQLDIHCCPRMKELFPPHLLPNLHSLEELIVHSCEHMVEIIGNGPESSICSTSTPIPVDFALPKLKTLYLGLLPELKSICSGGGKLICNSLQSITVLSCPKLKRMPISLPFVELNGQISPPSSLQKIDIGPREWWDSVEWGHPDEKGALLPLVNKIQVAEWLYSPRLGS